MRNAWVAFLIYLSLLILGSFILPTGQDSYFARIAMMAGISVIAAVSLNVVNGFTGQFSIGHAGFMAIGAYFAAAWSTWMKGASESALGGQLSLAGAVLIGGLLAALAGFVVGLPSLRLRGDYLAIATLGFGEIIRVVLENAQSLGGSRGFSMPASTPPADLVWIWGTAGFVILVAARLKRSTMGRAMLAVREDEVAAEAMGVSATEQKVFAFVMAAFFAGVAGALFAHFQLYLNPTSFSFMRSIEFVAMVVLGGLGSISGSVLAAIVLTILPEALRPIKDLTGYDLRLVLYGVLLMVVPMTRPRGLFGSSEIPLFRGMR
ncbi:MAG: branched-chain amino acid ABC transporter permease [Myxococcota bacterium]